MKKILFIILCLCLTITSYAATIADYTLTYEDIGITIIFNTNTSFSTEERQNIADSIIYGSSDDIATYSLCWLTGHNITSESVTAIEHKVSDTAPRCYMTVYNVETCSKCDYVNTESAGSTFLNCCPED